MSGRYRCTIDSPVGVLTLYGDGERLSALHMTEQRHAAPDAGSHEANGAFRCAREELRAYFAGELRRFSIALDAAGTEFQQRVWRALLEIPYGATESYGALAQRLGNPKASRAVGLANGRNPIGIVVPCHRVIGANGTLTGYGGGLPRKRWLLEHEARYRDDLLAACR
jgi:methylated-DNA-[protein]-cysteine S-methyltransferase